MKKITVVMPVYNTEIYLEKSIQSVLSQDIGQENFILIAINDGSTDKSLEILHSYEKKYPNCIKVVNQENQGVGKARNVGIELADSKYISFLDSDDYYEVDFLSKHVKKAEETDADVIISGFRRITSEGKVLRIYSPSSPQRYTKYSTMSSCNRIYRLDFLKRKKILFFENTFVEDTPFCLSIIAQGAEYGFIDYIGYNWLFNPVSFSSTKLKVGNEENTDKAVEMLEIFLDVGAIKLTNSPEFSYFMFKAISHQLLRQGKQASREGFLTQFYKEKKLLENRLPSALKLTSIIKGSKGDEIKVRLVVTTFFSIYKLGLMSLFARIYTKGEKI